MKKINYTLSAAAILVVLVVQLSCNKSTNTAVIFNLNIKSIWDSKCTACHQTGTNYAPIIRDDYASIKGKIDETIIRINKGTMDGGYMPKGGSKCSQSELDMFAKWKSDGLLEK